MSGIESVTMMDVRYVKENASQSAQVQRLMRQVDRETHMARAGDSYMSNAEEFPNHIHYNQTERVRRLLDII